MIRTLAIEGWHGFLFCCFGVFFIDAGFQDLGYRLELKVITSLGKLNVVYGRRQCSSSYLFSTLCERYVGHSQFVCILDISELKCWSRIVLKGERIRVLLQFVDDMFETDILMNS